jgi:PAS domain S-box-containing protein
MNKLFGTDAKMPNAGRHEKQQKKILSWLDKCCRYKMSLLVGLIGLSLSLTAFFVVNQWETQSRKQEFESLAETRCQLFEQQVKWDLVRLLSLRKFFDASQFVDRNEFAEFIEPIHLEPNHPASFHWASKVLDSDLRSFEKAVQAEGFTDFNIHCNLPTDSIAVLTQQREYYPVLYCCNESKWIMGFDMFSKPNLKKAIEKAVDTDQPVITTSDVLPKGKIDWPDIILVHPVYHKGLPVTTVEDRRLATEGVVACAITVKKAFDHVIHVLSPVGINLELTDLSSTEGRQFLYQYKSRLKGGDTGDDLNEESEASGLVHVTTFEIADRTWEIRATPSLAYLDSHFVWVCWIVFLGGLLLTALLVIQFYSMRNRTITVEKLVIDRTVQLQESNERFQVAFETANIAICLVDLDGRFRSVNNQMCTMYGHSREEFLSMAVEDITHPEDTDITLQFIQQVLSDEIDHQRFIKRYMHKEGHILWGEVSSSVIRDTQGNPIYFISYVLDITERKRVEEALRESQESWITTFNAMTDWVCLMDPITHTIINTNKIGEEFTGCPTNEMVGKKCYKIVHNLDKPHPDCPVQRIRKSKKREELEIKLGEDGPWLLVSVDPVFDENRKMTNVVHVVKNITERKLAEEALRESEANFRTLVETIPDLVWLKNPDGVYLSCNHRFESLFGVKEEEIVGKTDYDFVSKDQAEFFRNKDLLAIEAGKPTINEEEVTFADDGHKEFLETIKTPLFDSDGSLIGVLGVGRDITERRKAEKELLLKDQIFESALSANSTSRVDGIINHANAAFVKTWGYDSLEEIVGHPISYFFVNPDDALPILESLNKTDMWEGDFLAKRKDGSTFIAQSLASSIRDEKGGLVGYHSSVIDTSERKQAEKALRESEEKVRTLYDSSSDAIMLLDEKGFFDCNEATLRLFGCASREEFCSRHPGDFSPPTQPDGTDSISYAENNIAVALKEGSKRFEHLHRRLDGTDFPAEVLLDAMELGGKKVLQARVYDITDRKQAERKLRELGQAIEKSPEGIAVADLDGRHVFVNPAWAKMHGYQVADLMGKPIAILDTHEGRNNLPKIIEEIKKNSSWRGEIQRVRKDGSSFPAIMTSSMVTDVKDKPIGIVGTCIDITERKQAEKALAESEQRFRNITESMSDWIWEVDSKGVYTYVSSNVESILGYEEDEIIGRTPFDFMTPKEAERVGQLFQQIAANKEPINDLENWNLTKDSQPVCLLTNGIPLLDKEGNLLGYRGVDKDITETKRLQKLESRAERLETAGTIAGQVAHDFNNLLGPIMAYPEMIREELPHDHKAREYLDIIEYAARRIAEINQDLLTMGRRGHYTLNVLDLNDIVLQAVQGIESRAETVTCENDLCEDLLRIKGGSAQLHRMLTNLLANAQDAMEDVGRITIKTENYYADDTVIAFGRVPRGEYVKLTVSDNGCGIPDDIIQKILDPFFTTKTTSKKRGSGLGLSVVDAVMKDHNGYLDLSSKVGHGTSFHLYFPITREVAEEDESEHSGGGMLLRAAKKPSNFSGRIRRTLSSLIC